MAKEIRKLQQVGGGTFTVSVPKEWALEHGLQAGAAIHLYPHTDGSLVVRSSEHDGESLDRVELDASGLAPTRTATLSRSAYAVGYETIVVEGDPLSADQRAAIRRMARGLSGVESVSETETGIVLQNLFDTTAVSIQQAVDRMRSVVLSMHRTATELIGATGMTNTDGEVDRLRAREEDVDQSFGLVVHHLNRSFESLDELDALDVDRSRLFEYYQTGNQLEYVADYAVRIASLTARADSPLPTDIQSELAGIAETTRTVVDEATTALFEESGDRATDALAQYDATRTRIRERETQVTTPLGARTLDCLRLTNEAGGRIGQTALGRTVRPRSDC